MAKKGKKYVDSAKLIDRAAQYWPRAGPTGGAGVAWPAGICSFTYPVIFCAI